MGLDDLLGPAKFLYLHSGRLPEFHFVPDFEGGFAAAMLHMDVDGGVVAAEKKNRKPSMVKIVGIGNNGL